MICCRGFPDSPSAPIRLSTASRPNMSTRRFSPRSWRFLHVHGSPPLLLKDRRLFSADRLNRMIKYAMFHPCWMVAPMIDAAVVGLGRWGKSIVESVQGKSKRLRFVRGVCKAPEQLDAFAATHGLEVGVDFAHAIADPAVQAVVLAIRTYCTWIRSLRWRASGNRSGAKKPLALTRSEAERAVAACRDAGVILGLGNNKRCFACHAGTQEDRCERRPCATSCIWRVISVTSIAPASQADGGMIRPQAPGGG